MKLEIKRSVLRSVGRKEREREKKRTKQKYIERGVSTPSVRYTVEAANANSMLLTWVHTEKQHSPTADAAALRPNASVDFPNEIFVISGSFAMFFAFVCHSPV